MVLPIYVSLEKIDPRLLDAARDLYANPCGRSARSSLPLSLPGVFAGSLLVFIPAAGDFVNAELPRTPETQMIGNVVQSQFLIVNDYPTAAALSFVLMAIMLVLVLVYARLLGTEDVTDRLMAAPIDAPRPPAGAGRSRRSRSAASVRDSC